MPLMRHLIRIKENNKEIFHMYPPNLGTNPYTPIKKNSLACKKKGLQHLTSLRIYVLREKLGQF